ncbi:hypothetical protein TrST_g7783 [Triparma strigata]|uniref:Tyrosinase copper-binding domain-containing protein n=1 Tax=Triparma strigata TaxID=1606541 RepID=A0A9W7ESM6_9STRA|nr:hypothetical protein TrST_g7783 [Triparma strigata]
MGKGDIDDEFGVGNIGLTTGKKKPMGNLAFGAWSVLLAVVFLAIGIVIGTFVDTSTLGFSEATGSEVENVDLTNEITTGDRRRVTEATAFGHVECHLLNHNTAYYDTISQLTVVKENGWAYSMNTASYHIKNDNGLVFYGINGEELEFPGDGKTTADWIIRNVVASAAVETFELSFGRRRMTEIDAGLRASERENVSFEHQGRRSLSASEKLCSKSYASDCKTCIESQDSWCKSNSWDSSCSDGCEGPTQYMDKGCKEECAEAEIVSVKAKKTKEVDNKQPVDCVVGAWAAVTGSCAPITTGAPGGIAACYEKEKRTITTQPQHGGAQCPSEGNERLVTCTCDAVCGDGFLMEGEECDDGNTDSKDGCSTTCEIEPGWLCTKEDFDASECVNGKCECEVFGQGSCQQGTCLPVKGQVGDSAACTSDAHCRAAVCGDGIQTGIEQCDDGNTSSGDGCSSTCTIEAFHACEGGIGKITECEKMRVRKDYRDLSLAEKQLYIEAVNVLKDQGVYDLFVQTHAHLTNKDYAHGTSGFLPWHRKYLLEYENAIRSADPGGKYKDVTVPYWDWAEDTDLCSANGGCKTYDEKGAIFHPTTGMGGAGSFACSSHPHSGTIDCSDLPKDANGAEIAAYKTECESGTGTLPGCSGVDTWGSIGADAFSCSAKEEEEEGCKTIPANAVGCMRDGPFAGWMSPEFPDNKDTTNTCLTRGLNWNIESQGYLTGSQRLTQIITGQKDYGSNGGFRAYIESTPHANPHNLLGGHIRSFSSPADPLFFSHHAYIDKVWSMWQNCHDHDETDKNDLKSKEYRGTGGHDGLGVPLVFKFPGAASSSNACAKGDGNGACAACVHSNDGWCASNNWDQTCNNFCTGACSSSCGSSETTPGTALKPVAAGVNCPSCTQSYYQWDDATIAVKDFHSIHDLGYQKNSDGSDDLTRPNSYLYAPDQFDLKMKEQKGICDWTESAHHGKEWKAKGSGRRRTDTAEDREFFKAKPETGRRLKDNKIIDENGRELPGFSDKVRKLYAKHGEEPPARLLAAMHAPDGQNIEFCPFDTDGEWASDYNIIWLQDALGEWYPAYEQENFMNDQDSADVRFKCYCKDGKVWDLDGNTCISLMPDDAQVLATQDPDTKLILDYWLKLGDKLIEESDFVKDDDSITFSLDQMTAKECKLLYNEKSKIVRVDDVKQGTGKDVADFTNKAGRNAGPGSRATFLEGWGLSPCVGDSEEKCIKPGLADDPCDVSST